MRLILNKYNNIIYLSFYKKRFDDYILFIFFFFFIEIITLITPLPSNQTNPSLLSGDPPP